MTPFVKLAVLVFLAAIAAMGIAPPLERKYGKSTVVKWSLSIAVALMLTTIVLAVALTTMNSN